jgi:hypothetical protein
MDDPTAGAMLEQCWNNAGQFFEKRSSGTLVAASTRQYISCSPSKAVSHPCPQTVLLTISHKSKKSLKGGF